MDQGFSNYLLGNKQSLVISQVQEHLPSMIVESQFSYNPNNQLDSQFYDLYNYSNNVLKTWGINIGLLTPSRQNMKTVNGFMEMIRIRQRDLDYKQKIKEDVAKSEYQKDMMKNKIKLAQNQMNQYKKKLGQLENKYKEEQIKFRKQVKAANAEKQQLSQIKLKLEQKNTQICHQLKKKQAQWNRMKDSMKKGTDKVPPKNSFDLVSAINQGQFQEPTKFTILKQKYENQRKHYLRENSIMKQQLGDAEDIINNFISFIRQNCQIKTLKPLNLYPNHLMDYNQGHLLERLNQTLQNIKNSLLNIALQPAKQRPVNQIQNIQSSKSIKRANTLQIAQKLSQSVSVTNKPTTPRQFQHDYFNKAMKQDISIISHIEVKDIEMPLKGKQDYDKWDILYDGRF